MAKIRKRISDTLQIGRNRDLFSRTIDIFLIILIFLNIVAIVLESVPDLLQAYQQEFLLFEIFSVVIFSVEYLLRIWSCIELDEVDARRPVVGRLKYMLTPLVLIDLISILPFYLSFFVLLDLRFLRILRLLRIFKLTGSYDYHAGSVKRRSFSAQCCRIYPLCTTGTGIKRHLPAGTGYST